MKLIIDEMGKASAISQELKFPITSSDRLVNSDHEIYMMTEHNKPEQEIHNILFLLLINLFIISSNNYCIYILFTRHFAVVGFIKMGWKKLFLYDKQASRSEARVYCLLDFYIHERRQRKGYGIRLMQCMLQVIFFLYLIIIFISFRKFLLVIKNFNSTFLGCWFRSQTFSY